MIDFIDAQDEFADAMCQAEAVIGSLYNNYSFENMEPDHIASLLLLIKNNLKNLKYSYEGTIAAVDNRLGVSCG